MQLLEEKLRQEVHGLVRRKKILDFLSIGSFVVGNIALLLENPASAKFSGLGLLISLIVKSSILRQIIQTQQRINRIQGNKN